jgi:hypothetical protein
MNYDWRILLYIFFTGNRDWRKLKFMPLLQYPTGLSALPISMKIFLKVGKFASHGVEWNWFESQFVMGV